MIDIRSFFKAKDATRQNYLLDPENKAILRAGRGISMTTSQAIKLVKVLVTMLGQIGITKDQVVDESEEEN